MGGGDSNPGAEKAQSTRVYMVGKERVFNGLPRPPPANGAPGVLFFSACACSGARVRVLTAYKRPGCYNVIVTNEQKVRMNGMRQVVQVCGNEGSVRTLSCEREVINKGRNGGNRGEVQRR